MFTGFVRLGGVLMLLGAVFQGPRPGRVVAVGDVHGDFDALVRLLQKADLIDEAGRWTGGNATLVQVGDLVDRGRKSRAVLDFLMALEKEAPSRGGSVRISPGNHEMMNMMGDLRYVVAEDYAAFADTRSEQRRNAAFREYDRLQVRKGLVADRAAWMEAHPPGFVEHREAFSPRGKYGKWLRSLPVVAVVEDSAFLHGGINPALNPRSIDQINRAVKAEIAAFDRIVEYMVDQELALPFFTLEEFAGAAASAVEQSGAKGLAGQTAEVQARVNMLDRLLQAGSWLSVHEDGPLWFRGYATWSEEEGASQLAPLARVLGVKRFIVGHTPQVGGQVRTRFGGLVFLIDTGMIRGRASALEIRDGEVRAIYLN